MASFSSNCEMKFWLAHLHLNVTSKRIKLQMWDCAQKKALEKSFNLVTDKLFLKWTKVGKISVEKTCVFFNSGSTFSFVCQSVGRDGFWPWCRVTDTMGCDCRFRQSRHKLSQLYPPQASQTLIWPSQTLNQPSHCQAPNQPSHAQN